MENFKKSISELCFVDTVRDPEKELKGSEGVYAVFWKNFVQAKYWFWVGNQIFALQSHMKTCSQPLHEDTFGGHLKVGLAQIAAMEITRGNHRDNKAVIRYLPWLYHPPSAMQQG